jgi:hypothetical protein
MGRRPQDVPHLATGTSTAQPRQTPSLSAALSHRVVADDAMVAEHPGSLGRRRWGQSQRRPGCPTRPSAAPAVAWLRLCWLTPCQAGTSVPSADTTARMTPTATLTSAGRRRIGDDAVNNRHSRQVTPPVQGTRRPTDRLAHALRPADAHVPTARAPQRPGALEAGLWGGSRLMVVTDRVGWTSALALPHDRHGLRGTGARWGCGWPDCDAPADRLPHVDVGGTPTDPAPERADVRGHSSGTVVAIATQRPGRPQTPAGRSSSRV